MERKFFDRYKEYRLDNGFRPSIPFIKIEQDPSDKVVVYDKDSRLDKISDEYYGSPYFSWLILQANRHLPSMEFDIPENETLVVPYPLESGIERYINGVNEYKRLNG
jgi:hypothetical protein